MTGEAIFIQDDDRFTPTDLAVGPWDPGALHGGAPAALLVHVLGAHPVDPALRLARITYDFVRPAPLSELTARVAVVRPGRRVAVLDAMLRDSDRNEVTRARALLVAPSELGESNREPLPFAGPEAATGNDWQSPASRGFVANAVEIRFVAGRFGEPGPAVAWFRLRYPLIAGRPIAPLERAAAAGDFGNGIASVLTWDEHVFINPDLTLYLEREPVGEWVAMQSVSSVSPGAIATSQSVLWDQTGRIGWATQSLLVGRR
ncbi:MAG: thioesterase family protein [Solirubrobacteraceae bacterium]